MLLNSSLFSNASRLVHDSTCVPPHVVLIKPIGIFNSLNNSLAKKYPTAVKSPAVCGLHIFHSPLGISSCGVKLTVIGLLFAGLKDSLHSLLPVYNS